MKKKSPLELADELVDANLKWNAAVLRAAGKPNLIFEAKWSEEAKGYYQKALDIRDELEKISIDWNK